jgi:cytidylate kinase
MVSDSTFPVIAIDGPTASGKGTVAQLVANHLGFHYLDSGALYRIVGFASLQKNIPLDQGLALAKMTQSLQIEFKGNNIFLDNQEITELIRTEEMGLRASAVGAIPEVRLALLSLQKSFLKAPGLVADGRDMATVIFPEAILKVFLTASAKIRAERRFKQLKNKGISANIDILLNDLLARDERDTQRKDAPLCQAVDAHLLDTSSMDVEKAVQKVLFWYQKVSKESSN